MCNREKAMSFSGHRSERLPSSWMTLEYLSYLIYLEIDRAIAEGYDTFIVGGCYGFDLLASEMIQVRRCNIKLTDPDTIQLITVVPFEGQANHWSNKDRERYLQALRSSDEVTIISTQYKHGCYHERNRWLVDHSSRMTCYCDGSTGGTAYTVDYARNAGIGIVNLYEATQSWLANQTAT